jgi:hypothetical protein
MLRNYELTVKQVHLSIFWVSNLSSSSAFSNYSFTVHHLVKRDDRHLLTRGNGH